MSPSQVMAPSKRLGQTEERKSNEEEKDAERVVHVQASFGFCMHILPFSRSERLTFIIAPQERHSEQKARWDHKGLCQETLRHASFPSPSPPAQENQQVVRKERDGNCEHSQIECYAYGCQHYGDQRFQAPDGDVLQCAHVCPFKYVKTKIMAAAALQFRFPLFPG
jgi:hypothetical protein